MRAAPEPYGLELHVMELAQKAKLGDYDARARLRQINREIIPRISERSERIYQHLCVGLQVR